MPLKTGFSKSTIKKNIAECITSYRKTGTIGNLKPKSIKEAMKQCAAIAYSTARGSIPKGKSGLASALERTKS